MVVSTIVVVRAVVTGLTTNVFVFVLIVATVVARSLGVLSCYEKFGKVLFARPNQSKFHAFGSRMPVALLMLF